MSTDHLSLPMERALLASGLTDAGSFSPEEINMLVGVLNEALHELQLNHLNDSAATFVAQRIISLARRGQRDPIRLRRHALLTPFSD